MEVRRHDESETESPTQVVSIDTDVTLRAAGIYYVWGEIGPGSLKDIHQDIVLKNYQGSNFFSGPIQLLINSNGGDADETMALIDLLANVRFPVATSGFGTCASAAAMLLACGTKGLRTIAPNAGVMIHSYAWSADGKHHELVAHRKAQDWEYEKELAFWLKHSRYRKKKDVERHLLKKSDVWLTPREALAHGIVDHIGGMK